MGESRGTTGPWRARGTMKTRGATWTSETSKLRDLKSTDHRAIRPYAHSRGGPLSSPSPRPNTLSVRPILQLLLSACCPRVGRLALTAMSGILAWFWNERFWLPHNVTWADLKNTEEATFPQAEDLYLACPVAFCIFMVRLVFERFIARPCAMGLKIQANGPQKAQPNAILEKVFTAITKHPDEKRLEGLSKQLDWDVRTIQRWFRQRRNQEKPSTLTRFCESM
uniref:Homeobox domain-containing protein n=1 Tax=Knipowitschia caucasica TaxID=637954 RepID=A0AAV2K0G8_KNICA